MPPFTAETVTVATASSSSLRAPCSTGFRPEPHVPAFKKVPRDRIVSWTPSDRLYIKSLYLLDWTRPAGYETPAATKTYPEGDLMIFDLPMCVSRLPAPTPPRPVTRPRCAGGRCLPRPRPLPLDASRPTPRSSYDDARADASCDNAPSRAVVLRPTATRPPPCYYMPATPWHVRILMTHIRAAPL